MGKHILKSLENTAVHTPTKAEYDELVYSGQNFRFISSGYYIGDQGDVLSVKKGKKILYKSSNQSGYIYSEIYVEGKKIKCYIHREVARAFLEKLPHHQCVNHKNGMKQDNRLENLEYCTYSQNIQHAYDTGLKYKATKIVAQYTTSGEKIKVWQSVNEASKFHGVSPPSISACLTGRERTCAGYVWKYEIADKIGMSVDSFEIVE